MSTESGRLWLHGLIAAFVGGVAAAIDSGIVLLLVAPNDFNFGQGFWKLFLAVMILAVLTGIKTAAAYLKKSPVPEDWNGTERRAATPPGGVTP